MRVAVVGAGIAGIAAAHYAQEFADVTLYEASAVLGGHTDTHNLFADGRTFAVDSGFIVFNSSFYPLFSRWLDDLGVASKPTDMSFGVSLASGLEYGTSGLKALFCQRRNILRADFLAMLRDIRRFYRRAGQLVDDRRTLAELFAEERYTPAFVQGHLMPMCAALWSAPRDLAGDLPVAHVAAFMANHGLLQLRNRGVWRVVEGGSSTYLDAFESRFRGRVRKSCPVRHVRRNAHGVTLEPTPMPGTSTTSSLHATATTPCASWIRRLRSARCWGRFATTRIGRSYTRMRPRCRPADLPGRVGTSTRRTGASSSSPTG